MKIRVYIATTEGPVKIQRLAAEDPEVRSVICLNGTSEALPISPAYDAFVRKPTGIVERFVGHPVFRMDVSERITEGQSWQLGVLIAHLLKFEGKLAEKEEKPDQVIWLTGEVNQALEVKPVEHIDQKLLQSAKLFSACKQQNIPVMVVMAAANHSQLTQSGKNSFHLDQQIMGIDTVTQLTDAISLMHPTTGKTVTQVMATPSSKKGTSSTTTNPKFRKAIFATFILSVSILALSLIVTPNVSSILPHGETISTITPFKPNEVNVTNELMEVRLIELRSPAHSNCAAVRFGNVKPTLNELISGPDLFHSHEISTLCGIRLIVKQSKMPADINASVEVTHAGTNLRRTLQTSFIKKRRQGNELQWQINFDRTIRRSFTYSWNLETDSELTKDKLNRRILHSGY
ncbi:MAG: hypothetical protein JAZ19_03725 [Candidatus Thiodiazotropha taylori]|nr:hypothetical protein [Candidatus Thiodiazotropha taylori]